MAVDARIVQYEKDATDVAARKNVPAVVSAIQALTGVGALAVGFKSGNTAMMASGTGLLTSAASTF
jgi:NAD/NADP transhydrogenase beta subunit